MSAAQVNNPPLTLARYVLRRTWQAMSLQAAPLVECPQEIPISLVQIHISLKEIHKSKREIGISLEEIGKSGRELPISSEELAYSLKETRHKN